MLKRALIFSVVFIAVLMTAVFVIIDSMAVKDVAKRYIITRANYQFGLKVNVNDVKISYFNPAVSVTDLELEKQDGDVKIRLKVHEAKVNFDFFRLIRGQVSISGFKFVAPDADVEVEKLQKDPGGKPVNYSGMISKMMELNINRLEIIDGKFIVRIKSSDGNYDEFNLPEVNLRLRRGLLSNYTLKLNSQRMSAPIKYIYSVDVDADLKKDSIKFSKLNIGVYGGSVFAVGNVVYLDDLQRTMLNMTSTINFSLDHLKDYSEVINSKDLYTMKGSVSGKQRVSWQLSKGFKGLLVDGNIDILNFKWEKLNVPKVEVRGRYDQDHVSVSRLDVSDSTKSINIYDTTISMKPPYSVKGKGTVNDVELSKYLEMFGLSRCLSRFIAGGPFTFDGAVAPEIKISALFDLKIRDFWVLTKKGLSLNKQNSILDFKNGRAHGYVRFSAKGAYFDNFLAKSENNDMYVNGWVRDDATMDLNVKAGSFSMETYGRLGALPVKGTGSFSTRLMLDAKSNFSTEGRLLFNNVEILDKYVFGTVDTRVSYNDAKGILSFSDTKGKMGSSSYIGNIDIDLYAKNITINGKGELRNAYSEDVYKLFKAEDKLFGNPSGMVSGWVKFSGVPSWNTIRMDSKLRVKDVEFFSERFDELVADFTWSRGDLAINNMYMLKGKARFDFTGARRNQTFKVDMASKNLDISDVAMFSRKNVDVNGNIDIKGHADYRQNDLTGGIKLKLFDLIMGSKKLAPVLLNLDFGKNIAITFNIFDKEVTGDLRREGKDSFSLRANLNKFNAHPLGMIFVKELEEFRTEIDGVFETRFSMANGISYVKIDAERFYLYSSVVTLKNNGKVFVEYLNGNYVVHPFSLINESESNKCVLDIASKGKDITAKGCVGTAILKLFKGFVAGARGRMDVDLAYDGKLRGSVIPREFEIVTAEQKLGIISFNGRINISDSVMNMSSFSASVSGGNVGFGGTIDVNKMIKLKSFYPSAKLKMNIDKIFFEYPDDLKGRWSGNMDISGDGRPYHVAGSLSLFDAQYSREFDFTTINFSRSDKFNRTLTAKKEEPVFSFDIKASSGTDIFIKNDIFRGDLTFNINVKGTEKKPILIGSIDLLRGTITYLDNNFDLTSGRVKFKDDDVEPIVYQLDSESRIGGYQVYLSLVSYKGEPRFRLSSVPTLTEDKVLALLATGDAQTDFGEKQGGYGVTTGTGGQMVTQGLGVTGALKSSTGVGVKLKPPKNKDSAAPDVEVQKDLTDDLKLIYGKSLDEKTSVNKQEVNVQYDVNRNVQLKLLLEEDKKEHVTKEPTNAGVDVKFRFEF